MPDISFSFVDIVEILIISFLFYHILLWIKNTRAWNLFKGIIVILLFVLVAAIFQMNTSGTYLLFSMPSIRSSSPTLQA